MVKVLPAEFGAESGLRVRPRSSRAWGLCAKPAVLLGGPATRDLGPPALGGRYSQEEVAAGTGRGPGWMGEDGQLGAGG